MVGGGAQTDIIKGGDENNETKRKKKKSMTNYLKMKELKIGEGTRETKN